MTSTSAARMVPPPLTGPANFSISLDQPVAGDHLGAVPGEFDRDGMADAARGTGHDHAFAFERDQHESSWRMILSENRSRGMLFGIMR